MGLRPSNQLADGFTKATTPFDPGERISPKLVGVGGLNLSLR